MDARSSDSSPSCKSPKRSGWWLTVTIALLLGASVLAVRSLAPGAQRVPASNPGARAEGSTTSEDWEHGRSLSVLDYSESTSDSSVVLTLPDALERSHPAIVLPPASLVGVPEQIVLVGTETAPREQNGIAIRYANGVDVYAEPAGPGMPAWTEQSILDALKRADDLAEYRAPSVKGDESTATVQYSSGHPMIVVSRGKQRSRTHGVVDVEPRVVLVRGAIRYIIQGDAEPGLLVRTGRAILAE